MGKFYITIVKTRYNFEPQDDKVLCVEQVNYCNHEEVDSGMFYHLSLVATPSNVVMSTNDTDSLVIAMGCKQFYGTSLKLLLEVGTQLKNTIKYISIDQHVKNLVHRYAMRYQLLMPLQGVTIQRHLKGKGKSHLSSC